MGFETTTSCIRGKHLPTRPQGLHGRDRTTPRLLLNTLKVFFFAKAFARESKINCRAKYFKGFQY